MYLNICLNKKKEARKKSTLWGNVLKQLGKQNNKAFFYFYQIFYVHRLEIEKVKQKKSLYFFLQKCCIFLCILSEEEKKS